MTTDKSLLRKALRKRRRAVAPLLRRQCAIRALRLVKHYRPLQKASRIGIYWPMADEFDVLPIATYLASQGKHCFLPVVPKVGRRLWFVRHDERTRWKKNIYGIPEPLHAKRCRAEKLEVILVPLMAVDERGVRLGMGGGYYDTSLACRHRRPYRKPWLLGVGYDFQCVNGLASDPWDIRMDAMLTERAITHF